MLKIKGLGSLEKYLQDLASGSLRNIHNYATKAMAKRVKEAVKSGYMSANFPRANSTLEAYAHGTAFESPGLMGKSLVRTGLLVNSVVMRQEGNKFTIKIDPGAVYPTGKRVDQVAAQLEDPEPIVVRVTQRLRNYLAVIRGGGPSPSGRIAPVGSTIIIQMTPKPVWKPVYDKMRVYFAVYKKVFRSKMKQTGNLRFPGLDIS